LAAAGANIEPDLSGDAEIRIRLDLARAPLARSYSACRGFESLLRHTEKAPQTPRVR
jgi:hypothetical protein